ncbi:hypothetical protein EV286_103166 [Rhizobium sp. BK251]|nr:hypothetical protein EV286_103166 [Rhizobium sp. BK251]
MVRPLCACVLTQGRDLAAPPILRNAHRPWRHGPDPGLVIVRQTKRILPTIASNRTSAQLGHDNQKLLLAAMRAFTQNAAAMPCAKA